MKEVLYVKSFTGGGYLATCINYAGREVRVSIHETRAAVIKPKYPYPGYYCIFGYLKDPNEFGDYPLFFICERENKALGELMDSLIEDAVKMKARTIYADREISDGLGVQGFYRDLWQRITKSGLKLSVVPAPSVDDYEYGSALIEEWNMKKSIRMPNPVFAPTILATQIEGMTSPEAIKDPRFYAFHAFRYLLGGVVRDPLVVGTIIDLISSAINEVAV